MEVTKASKFFLISIVCRFILDFTDFDKVLPQVIEAINNATFVVIDCEFTGLNTVSDVNVFDSQKQYYEKVRNASKDFLVIQYGISAFR